MARDQRIPPSQTEIVETYNRVIDAMDEAKRKAWASLAGYKFWIFGYHAAAWVKANRLLPNPAKHPNPFKKLVLMAREEVKI